MKPSKRLAAGMAAALAVGGLTALAVSAPAQAALVNLNSGINNTGLQGPQVVGNKNINLTTTPASGNVGSALTVSVTSPDLTFFNGPAAIVQVNWSRIDAVVNIAGIDYLIKGPRNLQAAPIGATESIINSGWVVSSVTGSSSGATTNTGGGPTAASTGEGVAIINSSGVVTTPSTTLTVPAPGSAPPGTNYPITLKALVNNSVSSVAPGSGGTGTDSINDPFDNIYATAAAPGPYNGATVGTITSSAVLSIGPNAAVTSVTGMTGTGAVRPPLPSLTGYTDNPTNIALSGTVWGNGVVSGGFTAQFCDVTGTTCDTPAGGTITTSLTTDGSGNINGGNVVLNRTGFGAFLTTGNRAIKLTQGSNVALVPILVLGTPAITISPASGGPGTAVAVSGTNFNPGQPVVARGGAGTGYGTTSLTWVVSTDAPTASVNPNSAGSFGPISFTVNDTNTNAILALQNNTSGTYAVNSAGTQRANQTFTVNQDRCVAYNSNLTGGPGCNTKQNVNVAVLQGRLVQRAYVNATPTTGSIDGSAISTPVQGVSNVNTDATTVNLGTITTPLAPATIGGTLNDITVTDNRGGIFGWSLTATMPNFGGVGGNNINKANLTATPACAPATNATAWDYSNVGKVAISGFDDTLNAPGVTAGAAAQSFSGTVALCTKSTAVNVTTQTTGGVYNVTSSLSLLVPAFQAADKYTSTITVTLA